MNRPFKQLKTNRLSTKIILMVEVVLILSGSIFCAIAIVSSRVGIRKSIHQRMLDIANCAAGSVDGDVLGSMTAEDVGTPDYRSVYDALAVFRDNVELEYVYSIRDEGNGRFTFIVDTDPVAPGAFGTEVKFTEALAEAARGRAAVDEVPYTDAWGQFYSAYSPVYDSAGRVAGIIAADFSVEWFDSQLSAQTKATVIGYGIILLVTILAAAALSLVAVTPFVRKQEQLSLEVKKKADENEQLFLQIIRSLADAVDAKDPYTHGHSRRVSQYAVKLAESLGWDRERVNRFRYAALLHDIGKIGIPDSILNSPRRLTDVEYGIIKSHVVIGGDILKNGIMDIMVENVARYHHEWYDGNGYPQGLKGEAIPLEARIAAIADAFDAMSSNRIYRKACDFSHIRRELVSGKGRQFDPELTDRFIELWDQGALDTILGNNSTPRAESQAGSTEFVRKMVDVFISQETEGEDDPVTDTEPEKREAADVSTMTTSLHKSGSNSDVLEAEYRQFVGLYAYAAHLEERASPSIVLVLISLDPVAGEKTHALELEREMGFMERSIQQFIQNDDIVTKYEKQRFLIIMIGSAFIGAEKTVDRIIREYFKMTGTGIYMPSYVVGGMEGSLVGP